MGESRERLTAALEGRYRIEGELGVGGMASVYLAIDLKHERKVALKILKPELAAVVGGERFLHEIKVTANLQHPHILPLHDSGTADGLVYYVMPYVEGESLRERLDREKQLPVNEAVRIAVAVGSALDYAHRRDVIHRDIKPANILLQDGEPVVADFGIAIAVNAAGDARLTETGLSIGTPHYMSPEQAAGDRIIDGRSDVYALSATLYEMLTGDPLFGGSTARSVLAKILTEKPPLASEVREAAPVHVALAVRKGLAKLPADRFASAEEFVDALQDPRAMTPLADPTAAGIAGTPAAGPSRPWESLRTVGWIAMAAGVVGLAVGLLVGGLFLGSEPDRRRDVLRITLSADDHPDIIGIGDPVNRGAPAAIAPDGSFVIFVGVTDAGQRLFRRDLDSFEIHELAGTEGAFDIQITPDGRSVLFQRETGKEMVPVEGGVPREIMNPGAFSIAPTEGGLAYATVLIRAPRGVGPRGVGHLGRVPLSGGEPEIIAEADSASFFVQPQLLPDGETVLASLGPFWGDALFSESQLVLVDVESGEVDSLMAGAMPYFMESGHVVFFRAEGAVYAPFDTDDLEFTGPVQPFFGDAGLEASASLSVSRTGHLVTRESVDAGGLLVWVGLDGSELGAVGQPVGVVRSVDVSLDGEKIAVAVDNDIWVYPAQPGLPPLRLTHGGLIYDQPTWTSDGRSILMRGATGDQADIYGIAADGTGSLELLRDEPVGLFRPSAGPGDTVVFYQNTGADSTARDIWAAVGGWDDVREIVATPAEERGGELSPDGRWLAYVSDVTGTDEVYVTSFPDGVGRWTISNGGGWEPVWGPDGSRIFFRTNTDYRVADVQAEAAFRVTGVRPLFPRVPMAQAST